MEQDVTFIEIVKRHQIIYKINTTMPVNVYLENLKTAWEDVANRLLIPVEECQHRWETIKKEYAIIKHLIDNDKIPKNVLLHCNEWSHLGEILNFMTPYVDKIFDSDITPPALERVNKLLGLEPGSSLQVEKEYGVNNYELSTKNLSAIPEKSNTDKISNLHLELQSEYLIGDYFNIEPSEADVKTEVGEADVDTYSVDNIMVPKSVAESYVNNTMEIENYIIKEFVEDEISTEPVEKRQELYPNISSISETTVTENPIACNSASKETNMGIKENSSTKPETTVMEDPTASWSASNKTHMGNEENRLTNPETTVVVNPTASSSTTKETNMGNKEMRKFFQDLGEVLSTELAPEYQKKLQNHINNLLKDEFKLYVSSYQKTEEQAASKSSKLYKK